MGRVSKGEQLSSLGSCSRWLVVMLTIVNFIAGLTIAGLALYFILQENDVSHVMGHVFMTVVASVIVAAGLLMVIMGFAGCIGAVTLNKGFITLYIVLVSLICFLLIGGAVMAIAFRSQINEEVRGSMLKSIQKYGGRGEEQLTRAWDRTQRLLHCCAVDEQSWTEYRVTPWFIEMPGEPGVTKPFVPESCCKMTHYGEFVHKEKCQLTKDDPPGVKNGVANEALHYQGCFSGAKRHAEEYFGYAAGIGFGVFIATVIALIFAVILLMQLRKI